MSDRFPRRTFLITSLLTAALATIWAIATPLSGVPDEPSHVIRAVSVVRGELLGDVPGPEEVTQGSPYLRATVRVVQVPAVLDALGEFSPDYVQHLPCYAFDPEQHAGCLEYGGVSDTAMPLVTTAGEHPPLWYLIVGIPSVFSVDAAGIYAMRLVNVLIASALIGLAAAALRWDQSVLGSTGLLFALTPMVFFLMGGVNSSGPEIAAGLAVWAASLALLRGHSEPGWLIAIAGVGALALMIVRRPGPIWLVLVLAGALAAAGSMERIRALARQRAVWVWTGTVVVVGVLHVVWLTQVGTLGTATAGVSSVGVWEAVTGSLGNAYQKQVVETVGFFGWLDLPIPDIAVAAWLLALGGLLILGVLSGARRILLTALLVAGGSLLVMVVFEVAEAGNRYLFWQGRYSMPLLVGLPILLGVAVAPSVVRSGLMRVAVLLTALYTAAHTIGFFQYLRRNAVGVHGNPRFLWQPEWSAPLPHWLLFGLSIVVVLALAWWLTWVARARSSRSGGVVTSSPPGVNTAE